jgi:DNA repair protein RadA/Sms
VAALASSFRDEPLEARALVLGEVGLAGEVRAVAQAEARLAEAARLGFRKAFLPAGNARHAETPDDIEIVGVESVAEALERLF